MLRTFDYSLSIVLTHIWQLFVAHGALSLRGSGELALGLNCLLATLTLWPQGHHRGITKQYGIVKKVLIKLPGSLGAPQAAGVSGRPSADRGGGSPGACGGLALRRGLRGWPQRIIWYRACPRGGPASTGMPPQAAISGAGRRSMRHGVNRELCHQLLEPLGKTRVKRRSGDGCGFRRCRSPDPTKAITSSERSDADVLTLP